MSQIFGGYRTVWIITLFDLPTVTTRDKKAYNRFRKALLKDGFVMLQYSVYARHCASDEHADTHAKRVKSALPAKGEVRILRLTDKQFGRMQVFTGALRSETEQPPMQYELI